jgi:hypothetical protein
VGPNHSTQEAENQVGPDFLRQFVGHALERKTDLLTEETLLRVFTPDQRDSTAF